MKSHRLLLSTLVLSGGTGTALMAQTAAPAPDESRVPIIFLRPLRNSVSVGVKLTSGGGNVKFEGVGDVLLRNVYDPKVNVNSAKVNRAYDNGSINFDAQTELEKNPYVLDSSAIVRNADGTIKYDADGNVTLGPTTRVEANGTLGTTNGLLQDRILAVKWERGSDGRLPKKTVPVLNSDGSPVLDSSGNPTTRTFTVFKPTLDANGNVMTEYIDGDRFVMYNENATRLWEIAKAEQFILDSQGNRVGANFDVFGTRSQNPLVKADLASSKGVELSFERLMPRRSRRFEWGFKGTVAMNTIKGENRSKVMSTLIRARDSFMVASSSPYATIPTTLTLKNPDVNGRYDEAGNLLSEVPYNFSAGTRDSNALYEVRNYPDAVFQTEYTVPLSVLPVIGADGNATQYTYTTDGVEVNGVWQIKGAAVNFRIGPSARYYLNERFSLSGSVGVSVNYYSTRFNVYESFFNPGTERTTSIDSSNFFAPNGRDRFDNTKTGVVFGPTAELNLEWWVTPNTGFYFGGSYEKSGSYTQALDKSIFRQVAKVELGSGIGYRFGITTRF